MKYLLKTHYVRSYQGSFFSQVVYSRYKNEKIVSKKRHILFFPL